MIQINVKEALRSLVTERINLSEQEINRAVARSLNRTVISVRTASSKEIRGIYKIRARDIKKSFGKPNYANAKRLMAKIESNNPVLPLQALNPTKTKKGIRVNIKGQRKTFPGAFQATMKSGHKGIFARAKYSGNTLKTNEPGNNKITEVKTLAIPSALANDIVTSNLTKMVQERFPKTLAHELKFRSRRAAGLI